jgi:hypothetical protein
MQIGLVPIEGGVVPIQGSATGTNSFFQVAPGSSSLHVVPVERSRVRIDETTWCPTTFIPCRNLQTVKDNGCGRAFAFHHPGDDEAHLGFIVQLTVVDNIVTLFYQRWCGPQESGVPAFCLVPPNSTWDDSYSCHFVSDMFTYRLDSRRKLWPVIIFLNQICGPRPGGLPLATGLENAKDGGSQCSKEGPDFLLPFHRLPSDYKPIACFSRAFMTRSNLRADIKRKDFEFVPRPFFHSKKSRKEHKDFAEFGRKTFASLDSFPQAVFLVEKTPLIKVGGSKKKRSRNDSRLFSVPYLETGSKALVRFGLLDKPNLNKLMSFSDQLSPLEHDLKVMELQTREIVLNCIDLSAHPAGVRICTCSGNELEKLQREDEDDVLKFLPSTDKMLPRTCCMEGFEGGNEKLPGDAVMVSRWCQWPYDLEHVDVATSELFVSAYKSGFGSRISTEVIGLNLYQGTRQGEMATPDLTRGPGEGQNHQYYRKDYSDVLLPQCESILSTLTTIAKNLARVLDPIVYRLLMMNEYDHPVLGVCRRKILTMGLLANCLGFANTSHSDHHDFYPPATQDRFKNFFQKYLSSKTLQNKICAEYLQRWVDQYGGFCRPTTCGYLFSGALKGDQSKIEIIQYFVMEGLGLAVRFLGETVHHFYGHLFTHNTAVCVAIGSDGKVSYRSDPAKSETFRVFAWGGT